MSLSKTRSGLNGPRILPRLRPLRPVSLSKTRSGMSGTSVLPRFCPPRPPQRLMQGCATAVKANAECAFFRSIWSDSKASHARKHCCPTPPRESSDDASRRPSAERPPRRAPAARLPWATAHCHPAIDAAAPHDSSRSIPIEFSSIVLH